MVWRSILFLFALLLLCNQLQLAAPVEIFDEAAAGAPLLLHLDEEFEEDACAEEGFDVLAGGGADAFEHLALLADQGGLLAGALAEDGGGDLCHGQLAVLHLL